MGSAVNVAMFPDSGKQCYAWILCEQALITAYPRTETAVEALHQNAFDYLGPFSSWNSLHGTTMQMMMHAALPRGEAASFTFRE